MNVLVVVVVGGVCVRCCLMSCQTKVRLVLLSFQGCQYKFLIRTVFFVHRTKKKDDKS